MSQMTKCDEGHFYDKSQNTKCPFCGVGAIDMTRKYVADAGEDKTKMYTPADDARKPGGRSGPDPDATVAVWKKNEGIDPVVGWLVCSQGANRGRDYRIRSGYNNIGRDTSSQICIAGDETISREEHARIFYDPKNASFHVIAGTGRSGVYVNDQAVLQPTLLKAHDVVEVGSTRLVFIPFCGDRFRWDIGA